MSIIFAGFLFWGSGRRKAAVGMIEFRLLLVVRISLLHYIFGAVDRVAHTYDKAYALHCVFQVVTMSALLQQGALISPLGAWRELKGRLDGIGGIVKCSRCSYRGWILASARERSHCIANCRVRPIFLANCPPT